MPSSLESGFLEQLADSDGRIKEIGADLGLDAHQAESLATKLMTDGLIELKSLSGLVAITETGRGMLGPGDSPISLAELADALEKLDLSGLAQPERDDAAADIAALKAQAERSKPLTIVLTGLHAALREGLAPLPEADKPLAGLANLLSVF